MSANASAMQAAPAKERPWWLMLIDGFAILIIGGVLLWGGLLQKTLIDKFLSTDCSFDLS